MSIQSIKKILLAGTALVAVTAFGTGAHASAPSVTATGANTWAESHTQTGLTVITAAAGDGLALSTFVTTVSNDQTANDGSGLNTFNLGAVSTSSAGGALTITTGAGSGVNTLLVNIGSLTNTVTAISTTINNTTVQTGAVTVNDAGIFSTSGNLALTNSDATTAKVVGLNVTGNYTSAGTSTITATGAASGANAVLTLGGATNTFGTAVTLTDTAGGAGGHATVALNGTGPQSVAGAINGNAADEGVLNVNTVADGTASHGATFSNAISNLHAITAGVAGTTTTFNGASVGATTTTFTGTGTINMNGSLTGIVDFANNAGTFNLGTGANITGGVTSTGGVGVGTLVLAGGTQTVSVAVGAPTAINIVKAGAHLATSTFTGGIIANTLDVTGDGTVVLGASSNAVIDLGGFGGEVDLNSGFNLTGTGTVDNSSGTGGILKLKGGTQSIAGAIGTTGGLTEVDAGQAGGATTFDGAVKATTVKIGTGTAAFDGNVTGLIDFGGNNGQATLATTATTLGAVDSTVSSSGKLIFTNATQSVGAVGSTFALTEVDAGQSGGATTFNSTVKATTVKVGSGSATFSGALTGALTAGAGTPGLGQGSATLNAASTGITTIDAGATLHALTLGANVTASGAVFAADTTNLGTHTLTADTTFGMGAITGQTLTSTVTDATHYGNVAATGNATVALGSKVNLTIGAVPSATTIYTLVSGAAGGSVIALGAGGLEVNGVTDVGAARTLTAGLVTYSQITTGTGAHELEIEATRNNISTLGSTITANDASVDAALNTIGTTGNAAVTTAVNNVATAAGISAAAAHNATQSLQPAGADGSSNAAVLGVGGEVSMALEQHSQTSLLEGNPLSGVAAGATSHGYSMWAEGYGQHAHQDLRDSVNGYSGNTWGGVVGADSTALLNKAIVGVAVNYGHSIVNSENANTTATDIGNYGINLYGTYDLGQKMFVNGQAGYAYNTIDTTRHNVGLAGVNANGSTSSDEFDARADVGRDYPVSHGATLTPDVSAAYTYLNTKGYTETGSGANLVVGSNSQNALNLGVGGTASWKLKSDDNVVKPSLHAGYAYDVVGDRISTTSSFAGAPGVNFITNGASPQRSTFDLGAKLVYTTQANWDVSATYDFQVKQSYTANTGEVRATAHF